MKPRAVECPRCGSALSIHLDEDYALKYARCTDCGVQANPTDQTTAFRYTASECLQIVFEANENLIEFRRVMEDPATWED